MHDEHLEQDKVSLKAPADAAASASGSNHLRLYQDASGSHAQSAMNFAELEDRIARVVEDRVAAVLDRHLKDLEKPRQECFSIKEVAIITGLEKKRISRAIRCGELLCSNLASGKGRATYRIHYRDIMAWLESKRLKQGPAKAERQKRVEEFFGPKRKRRLAA